MEVVEHQDERLDAGELLQQLAQRAVGPIALVAKHRSARGGRQVERGQHLGELGADVVAQGVEAAGLEPLDVLVERVHEDPEGQVALELRRPSRQHELAGRVGARRELGEEARLADPGLPHELDDGRRAALQAVQGAVEDAELRGASNDLLGDAGHDVLLADHNPPAPRA